jgi:hypothetical protein
MAGEQGYTTRVMPQAGAAMPLASARTYGAELADTVGQVAQDVHQRQIRSYQLDRRVTADREAADFAHKFALQRQNMDDVVQQLRANPTRPDYGEHVNQAMQTFNASRDGLLAGISDDQVRQRASEQLDSFADQLHGSEATFAAGQQVAKTVMDVREAARIGANRVRQSGDPDSFGQELGQFYSMVNGMAGLTPVQRQQLRQEGEQDYGVAFGNRLIDTNPHGAVALIDAGSLNGFLKPEQVDALRNGAQVEIRRSDAAAEHALALAAAQTREQIATVKEQSKQGIDVSGQLPDLIGAAQKLGDTSTVVELQGMARDSVFAKVWGASPPLAREHRIAALQAKPAGERSQDEQTELKWLVDKKGSLDSKFNSDPVGFALSNAPGGMGPPPIETWSPDELAARAKWVAGAREVYGTMPPLTKAEATSLSQRAVESDKGYNQALDLVGRFPGRMAGSAARQVFPSDPYAQQLAVLSPQYRKLAIDGREALKANPKLKTIASDRDKDDVAELVSGFHQALAAVPSAQRTAILGVAGNIAASALEGNGGSGGEMNRRLYAAALDRALGATGEGAQKRGGLGSWAGRPFLVPDAMTQIEFGNTLGRFIKTHPAKAPVNPDGSPIEIRKMLPIAQGGGLYRFYVGERVVTNRDGKPFEFRAAPQ